MSLRLLRSAVLLEEVQGGAGRGDVFQDENADEYVLAPIYGDAEEEVLQGNVLIRCKS